MSMRAVFHRYIRTITPPYGRKDFIAVFLTLFFLLLIPITVLYLERTQIWKGRAESLPFTNPPNSYFPYGIFDDANQVDSPTGFNAMLTDIKTRGMDGIFLTNGFVDREGPMLDQSDQIGGVSVYLGPQAETNNWFDNPSLPATIDYARTLIYPLVDKLKSHPSLRGYAIKDDAGKAVNAKLTLAYQAFNERDNTRPVMPTLTGAFFDSTQGVYATYWHPVKVVLPPCNLDADNFDFAHQIGRTSQNNRLQEQNIPLWDMAVQAYGMQKTYDPNFSDTTALREPTVEEIRLQNWLHLGEGVKGMFWMTYKDHIEGAGGTNWTGLQNNPELYAEVTDLTGRVNALKSLLLTLKRDYNEKFTVTASDTLLQTANKPSLATLVSSDGNTYYVLVSNKSCSPQNISLATTAFTGGQLKDLESNTISNFGTPISFRAGDGKIFQVVNGTVNQAVPPASPNLLVNGGFESPSGGFSITASNRDTTVAHTGTASLKLTGPASSYSWQAPTLKPNTLYAYSYWVKTQNVTGNGVALRFPQTSPSAGENQDTPFVNGTTDWKQVVGVMYPRTNYVNGRVDLQWYLGSGETAWVDDIVVCEGPLGCNGTFSLPPLGNPALPTPTPTPVSVVTSIPSLTLSDYTQDVEDWWASNPFNPDNPSSIPVGGIGNVSPVVNVKTQFNGDIQAAIDSLPAAGGTIFFDPGTYTYNFNLIGKSNIHFVSNGGVTILGGRPLDGNPVTNAFGTIATCSLAASYNGLIGAIFNSDGPDHQAALTCINNRKGNIYFKNLIFDGQNTAYSAFRLAATRDVVFDNVTFQNFVDSTAGGGFFSNAVFGHEVIDNVWFRNCTFKGNGRFAVYLDGIHIGGVINSSTDFGYGSGGILFLTNDDYTYDYNQNGSYDNWEQRMGNYLIVQGNTFSNRHIAIAATSAHTLVKNNTAGGLGSFAGFAVRNSDRNLVYNFYGNKIINNYQNQLAKDLDGNVTYVGFGGNYCTGTLPNGEICARYGQNTVKDNIIKTDNAITTLVLEGGTPVAPEIVTNNCVNGTYYGTSTPCSMATPTPTPSSTVLTPTSLPQTPTPTGAILTPTPTTGAIGNNLLVNSSFEANNSGTPASWSRGVWDTTVAHTGVASLRLDGPGDIYAWQAPILKPNTTYTMQGWVKTSTPTTDFGAGLRYPVTANTAVIFETQLLKGTNNWTFVTKQFTTPSDYAAGRLDLHAAISSGASAWFDDVALCEGSCGGSATSTPVPPTVTPTRTPTPLPPTPTRTPTLTPTLPPPATPTPAPIPDTQAPVLSITSPLNNSTVTRNKPLTIQASATDNIGVVRVDFFVNTTSFLCSDTTSPYSCTWKVPARKNATYTLSAKAYDAAGNFAISSVKVTAK